MFGAYVDGESLLIGLQDLSLDGCQLKDVGIYEREILPGNVCSPMMLKALHKLCCKKKKITQLHYFHIKAKRNASVCVPVHKCFQLYEYLHPRCFSYSRFFSSSFPYPEEVSK